MYDPMIMCPVVNVEAMSSVPGDGSDLWQASSIVPENVVVEQQPSSSNKLVVMSARHWDFPLVGGYPPPKWWGFS